MNRALICTMGFMILAFAGRAAPPENAIPLWPEAAPHASPEDDFQPYLIPFTLESDTPRGAVIVLPGGGYSGRAPHEADPIAQRINEAGMHAFVCHYRVSPHRHPAPWLDATRSVKIVRHRAKEWNILPERVAVLGFSAGGHLAASTGVLALEPEGVPQDEIQAHRGKPDAMVLCYPVISAGSAAHRGSFFNLLGKDVTREQLEALSLETKVSAETPPAFLWSTSDDEAVPVENSLLFSLALRNHGVPFELHVYPSGPHGLGLAAGDKHIATWMPLCVEWLESMGW